MQPYAHSRLLDPRGGSLQVSRGPTHIRLLTIIGYSKDFNSLALPTLFRRLPEAPVLQRTQDSFPRSRKRTSRARSSPLRHVAPSSSLQAQKETHGQPDLLDHIYDYFVPRVRY
jgi:hypothetical protein